MLQTFVDKPKQWDAWNIDADFEKQHWDLDKADEVKLVESGPLRAVIRVKNHFQNSTFVRDITLYAGVARVDVKMQAEWHEKHILLKVAFPVSAHSDKATYEIPFGSVERPTTRNTPAEQAQFEVPAQRWADISDAKHGLQPAQRLQVRIRRQGQCAAAIAAAVAGMARSSRRRGPSRVHLFALSARRRLEGCAHHSPGYELNYKLISLPLRETSRIAPARALFPAGEVGQRHRHRDQEGRGRRMRWSCASTNGPAKRCGYDSTSCWERNRRQKPI